MTTPDDILLAVKEAGGRLEHAGNKIRALLPADCPPELKTAIRNHKAELLAILQTKAANLPDDCAHWLHIARQVLAGEFIGANKSTVESLTIGLRYINHKLCREALASLPANKEKPRA